MKSCLRNDDRTVHPVFEQLHGGDAVVTGIRGLLLPEEARYLMDSANGKFVRSKVTGNAGESLEDDVRTSSTAFLEKGRDDVISCIEHRLATIAQHPTTHLEPLQVTDYQGRKREQYKYHHDYFDTRKDGKPDRTTTIFAYLHSENLEHGQCGGSTMFGELKDERGEKLRIYPKMGDAVMWSNRTFTGNVNPRTLHSGEAVSCDSSRKVGLNAWFRDAAWS
jgi:hypothetical protein